MFRSEEEYVRVGVGIVLIAAVVGLLVLLLHGTAYPAEPAPEVDEAARVLASRAPLSPAERVAEARSLLARERRSRIAGTLAAVGRGATSAVLELSPLRLAGSLRGVWKELRRWRESSPRHRAALARLEPEVRAGLADPETLRLYEELRRREARARSSDSSLGLRTALGRGDALDVASQLLGRRGPADAASPGSLELEAPDAARALEVSGEVASWEASMAAALLAGEYAHVAGLGPSLPDADLTRAAALYLSGEHDRSLASLEELRAHDRGTPAARLAEHWLSDPLIDPEDALLRERRSYRLRQTLGWIGGERLEENGLSLSRDGFRSWRRSLAPLNLALSLPARIVRGRPAEGENLRVAAERYLEAAPEGPRALDALDWWRETEVSDAAERNASAWDDGVLVLPPAQTRYGRVVPTPLVITRELVDTLRPALASELHETLADADALVVEPVWGPAVEGSRALPSEPALEVLAGLARAVEEGSAVALDGSEVRALDAIRRLDLHVRAGNSPGLRPWYAEPDGDQGGALLDVLFDGSREDLGAATLARGGDDLRASRAFGASPVECARPTVCLDRKRALETLAIASVDLEGNLRLGARAAYRDAALDLQLKNLQPSASLVLPLSRWLGFSHWLHMEARIGVGLDGIWVNPEIRDPDEPTYATELLQ